MGTSGRSRETDGSNGEVGENRGGQDGEGSGDGDIQKVDKGIVVEILSEEESEEDHDGEKEEDKEGNGDKEMDRDEEN
jgi:hypothetical protein